MCLFFLACMSGAFADSPPAALTHSECITAEFCLCVTNAIQSAIDQKQQYFRDQIRAAHAKSQFAIYLSVPLSSSQGSYFALNREVAASVAERLSEQLGATRVWILNPATSEADLPAGATQSDYMYLWGSVLYGAEQTHEGLDQIYFVGPKDFGRYLKLTGHGDLDTLAAYYKHRVETDASFAKAVADGKNSELAFTRYYGLRASAAFSAGAHDEWNLVALINRTRLLSSPGILGQLPILFDGNAIAPPLFDSVVARGNVGQCK